MYRPLRENAASSATTFTSKIAGLVLLLAGCGTTQDTGIPVGGSTTASAGTGTGWWDGSSGNVSTPVSISDSVADSAASGGGDTAGAVTTNATSPATDDGEATGEREDDGPEVHEDEVGWFGFTTVMPGSSAMGEEEFVAFIEGEDLCVVTWVVTSMMPNESCAECEFAFDVTREEPFVEVDEDCESYIDVGSIAGTISIGYGDETVFVDRGEGWEPAGEGEFLPRRENAFEWYIPLGER